MPQGLGVSCFLPSKQQDPIPPPLRPLLNVTLPVNSFLRRDLKSTYQPCSQHSPDRIYLSAWSTPWPPYHQCNNVTSFSLLREDLPEAEDMYLFCSLCLLSTEGSATVDFHGKKRQVTVCMSSMRLQSETSTMTMMTSCHIKCDKDDTGVTQNVVLLYS